MVYLFGDSTIRQWFEYLTAFVPGWYFAFCFIILSHMHEISFEIADSLHHLQKCIRWGSSYFSGGLERYPSPGDICGSFWSMVGSWCIDGNTKCLLTFIPLISCETLDKSFTSQNFISPSVRWGSWTIFFSSNILGCKIEVDTSSCLSPSFVWPNSKFIIDLTVRKQPNWVGSILMHLCSKAIPVAFTGYSFGVILRWSWLLLGILVGSSMLSFLVSLLGSGAALQPQNKTPLTGGPSLTYSGPFPLPGRVLDQSCEEGCILGNSTKNRLECSCFS